MNFELVMGPSIWVEPDELEINHRNADVGQSVDSLTSRIKGYRARGQLTQAVPLRKPVSELCARYRRSPDGRVDLVARPK